MTNVDNFKVLFVLCFYLLIANSIIHLMIKQMRKCQSNAEKICVAYPFFMLAIPTGFIVLAVLDRLYDVIVGVIQ